MIVENDPGITTQFTGHFNISPFSQFSFDGSNFYSRYEGRELLRYEWRNEDTFILYTPCLLKSPPFAPFQLFLMAKSLIRQFFDSKSFITLRVVAHTGSTKFEDMVYASLEILSYNDRQTLYIPRINITRYDDPTLKDMQTYPVIDSDCPEAVYTFPEHPNCVFLDRKQVVSMRGAESEDLLFKFRLKLHNTDPLLAKMANEQ